MGFNRFTMLRLLCMLFAFVSSTACAVSQLNSPLGPVVNLGYAAFLGNSTSPTGQANGPVTFFGGIPYARPPLGELRFRAPVPLDENEVIDGDVPIMDARNWGPVCIQQPAQVGVGQEDCLTLNIWKPSDAKEGDKLPVIVYIHGGGFHFGTAQGFPLYDWVNQSNPKVIGVSITYRLNILGFLAGRAVQEDGDLNVGLLDQRAALEWVQRHITSFGGDPDEVTIDGQSAGGGSVAIQMAAYGGTKQTPFKRAIGQSSGWGLLRTRDEAEPIFKTVADVIGCPASGINAMPCLRNASLGAIIAAINALPWGAASPVIDGPGGILPDLWSSLIRSGNFSMVDFMGGHCTDDGSFFLPDSPQEYNTDADVIRLVFDKWRAFITNETIQEALALYPAPGTPGSPYGTQYDRAVVMYSEIDIACIDWFLADRLQQEGAENVFTYKFNSPNPVLVAETPWRGVMHTSELFYLFDGTATTTRLDAYSGIQLTFTPFNNTEAALSKESIAYWTSFVSSGMPSTSRKFASPEWMPFSSGSRMVLNQLTNSSLMASASMVEVIPPDQIERCKFWMSAKVTNQTRI